MNLVIAKQSKRPDWKHWKRLGSVKLKDAILLSLDICPIWYKDYIIDNYQRADNPDDPSCLTQSEVNSLLDVLNYTESEYSIRLQVVQSWAFKQDWFIEKKDFTSKDINENMLVDLKKFFHAAFNQMDFCNEYDEIPTDMRTIQGEQYASESKTKHTPITKERNQNLDDEHFRYKMPLQEETILKIIKDLGCNPLNITPYRQGQKTSHGKSQVRDKALEMKHVFINEKVFNSAWQRLLTEGKIANKAST